MSGLLFQFQAILLLCQPSGYVDMAKTVVQLNLSVAVMWNLTFLQDEGSDYLKIQ
jgi:hypothetical protein